jgi:hypothetical protein
MSEDEVKKRLDKLQTELVSLQENFKNFRGLIIGIYVTIIAPLILIMMNNQL